MRLRVMHSPNGIKMMIKGHEVLVDDEDLPLIRKYSWHISANHKRHYAHAWGGRAHGRKIISMHRLLMGFPAQQIDHINGNGLDNRRLNIRLCSKAENLRNRNRRIGASGFRGVRIVGSRYVAQIQINGKKYQRCGFRDAESAARAYDEMSKDLHGEFGILNFKYESARGDKIK